MVLRRREGKRLGKCTHLTITLDLWRTPGSLNLPTCAHAVVEATPFMKVVQVAVYQNAHNCFVCKKRIDGGMWMWKLHLRNYRTCRLCQHCITRPHSHGVESHNVIPSLPASSLLFLSHPFSVSISIFSFPTPFPSFNVDRNALQVPTCLVHCVGSVCKT